MLYMVGWIVERKMRTAGKGEDKTNEPSQTYLERHSLSLFTLGHTVKLAALVIPPSFSHCYVVDVTALSARSCFFTTKRLVIVVFISV